MSHQRTGYNNLRLEVLQRASSTRVGDPYDDLPRAEGITFSTFFPGGLYGEAEAFFPRDPDAGWNFRGGQTLRVLNNLDTVYEGQITGLGYIAGADARQGRRLRAAGLWGQLLGVRGWRKPWADTRITDAVWAKETANAGDELHTLDRNGRLRLTPKSEAQTASEICRVRYTAPTGETIKRVTCAYDLQEGVNNYAIRMYDNTGAAVVWSVSVTGNGTQDVTLGTPRQVVDLEFFAQASFTPPSDGSEYGEVSSVVVYTETGSINAQEILRDLIGRLGSDINTDETQLGALTLALVPFVTNGWETLSSIALRAAAFGDSSYNAWYPAILASDVAATPNGRPVLALAQYPVLTDYDYAVQIGEANLQGPFEIVKDFDAIRNYIIVRYTDLLGVERYLTPADDANLTDSTSVSDYGQRETVVDAGVSDSTEAANIGRRYLAALKDPRFYVQGPITVRGYIRGKGGQRVPAASLRAGKRVKVENFLTDEASVTGAGLTFIVSQTTYRDDDETCALTTGVPDDLAVFLAQLAQMSRNTG